jgi:hypothetical protein
MSPGPSREREPVRAAIISVGGAGLPRRDNDRAADGGATVGRDAACRSQGKGARDGRAMDADP